MKPRFAAAITSVGILLATPAGAFGAGTTTTTSSQITPTAPPRLTTTSATATTVRSASTDTSPGHAATLPNTGYDLLPETLIGLALVGAGVGLKLRRSRA